MKRNETNGQIKKNVYPQSKCFEFIDNRALKDVIKSQLVIVLDSIQKLLVHKIKNFPSHIVRDFIYKSVLMVDKGPNSVIYYGCEIRDGFNLIIGKGSIIGDNCIIDARGGIKIGDNVNLSSDVKLWTGSHEVNSPYFSYKCGTIIIGNRAWISSNAIVLGNVNIGEGAVVCANAVVTTDVEPFSIVAGIPAKEIGKRESNLRYNFKVSGMFL